MGNSEDREKRMSILICGDKNVGNHKIAKALLTTGYEEISRDKYKCKEVIKFDVKIESTLYVKNDLKDRKTEKHKKSYYSGEFDKINAAVFVFDFSNESSFELLKAIIKDFEASRPGFGVAIIGNNYVEDEKLNLKLNEAQNLAIQYQFDYDNFHKIGKIKSPEKNTIMKKDMKEIRGIFEKVYHNMAEKKGCC